MPDMQTALKNAGLQISAQARAEQEVAKLNTELKRVDDDKKQGEDDRRFSVLAETDSPNTFRREARRLLWTDYRHIDRLVELAHDRGMKEKNPRLIASLLGLRKSLKGDLSGSKRGELIDDALNWK